jgi:hypothetical protein
MKRALLLLTLVLAILVPASLALAGLPKPADPKVVVPTTLAGLKLGMAEGKALSSWGGASRAKCSVTGETKRCFFNFAEGPKGHAIVEFRNHKLSTAAVYAGRGDEGSLLTTAAKPIMEMKGKNGVGIGSTFAKLKAAYPKGKQTGEPGDFSFAWTIAGKGQSSFSFELAGDSQRVIDMILTDGLPG